MTKGVVSELIKNFGIDWRLLLAQGVNFLILLYVLKRFAYAPIIAVLKKRRQDIEQGLLHAREAGEKRAHMEKEREELLKKARSEGMALILRAEEEGKRKTCALIDEANRKVEDAVGNAQRVISEEKRKMGKEIEEEAEDLIRQGIARVLGKMEPEERDNALIKEALRELKFVSK